MPTEDVFRVLRLFLQQSLYIILIHILQLSMQFYSPNPKGLGELSDQNLSDVCRRRSCYHTVIIFSYFHLLQKPQIQFQLNLAQCIHGPRKFKFVQMTDHALLREKGIIKNIEKNVR